jgi:hypothetical protein
MVITLLIGGDNDRCHTLPLGIPIARASEIDNGDNNNNVPRTDNTGQKLGFRLEGFSSTCFGVRKILAISQRSTWQL